MVLMTHDAEWTENDPSCSWNANQTQKHVPQSTLRLRKVWVRLHLGAKWHKATYCTICLSTYTWPTSTYSLYPTSAHLYHNRSTSNPLILLTLICKRLSSNSKRKFKFDENGIYGMAPLQLTLELRAPKDFTRMYLNHMYVHMYCITDGGKFYMSSSN